MKKKIFSQTLLGVCIAWMVTLALPAFSQTASVNSNTTVEVELTVKNKSGKTIKSIILIDQNDQQQSVLKQVLEVGKSAKFKLKCGNYYVQFQHTEGQACDWGEINACKKTSFIIKTKCPIEEDDEQDGKK